jgi:hypothetical protein
MSEVPVRQFVLTFPMPLRFLLANYRIAIGPHAGRKALTLYSVPPVDEPPDIPLRAKVAGFSLHAATVCEAHQRSNGPCTPMLAKYAGEVEL